MMLLHTANIISCGRQPGAVFTHELLDSETFLTCSPQKEIFHFSRVLATGNAPCGVDEEAAGVALHDAVQ